jgi:hypothetical protein
VNYPNAELIGQFQLSGRIKILSCSGNFFGRPPTDSVYPRQFADGSPQSSIHRAEMLNKLSEGGGADIIGPYELEPFVNFTGIPLFFCHLAAFQEKSQSKFIEQPPAVKRNRPAFPFYYITFCCIIT